MGKVKQIMDRLEEDYESTKKRRNVLSDMTPLDVNYDNIEIVYKGDSVFYITGDTTKVEFWRAIRNSQVENCECNDDWQWDIGCYKFQKELLTEGIFGKIKIALIGADETDEVLKDYGKEALKEGYIPLYWCWCHDIYAINDHVKKALMKTDPSKEIILDEFVIHIPTC